MKLVVVFVLVFIQRISQKISAYQQKMVCFGENMKIECNKDEEVRIYEAFYEGLHDDSTICGSVGKSIKGCSMPQLVTIVRDQCDGRIECSLNHTKQVKSRDAMSCQRMMYLKILYKCAPRLSRGPPPRRFSSDNVSHVDNSNRLANGPIQGFGKNNTMKVTISPATNLSKAPDIGTEAVAKTSYSYLLHALFVFLDIRMIIQKIKRRRKKFLLCIILSMGGGILLLLFYFLLFMCCRKCRRKRKKLVHESVSEISAPLLERAPSSRPQSIEHPQDGTELAILPRTESTSSRTRRDSGSRNATLTRGGTLNRAGTLTRGQSSSYEIISTIRRSHSIDECTQTDMDEVDASREAEPLSEAQVQELGYLVDVMKYYNNKLEDDFRSDSPKLKSKNTAEKNNQSSLDDSDFYFTKTLNSFPSEEETKKKTKLKKQISFNNSTENSRYFGDEEMSSSDEKFKTLPLHYRHNMQRNPSQMSSRAYATSATSNDIEMFTPDSVFDEDPLQSYTYSPRTPKLGVRGDGFDVIMGEPAPPSR